jgi:hypothetical protein
MQPRLDAVNVLEATPLHHIDISLRPMHTSKIDAPKGETERDIIRSMDLAPLPLGNGGRWEIYLDNALKKETKHEVSPSSVLDTCQKQGFHRDVPLQIYIQILYIGPTSLRE